MSPVLLISILSLGIFSGNGWAAAHTQPQPKIISLVSKKALKPKKVSKLLKRSTHKNVTDHFKIALESAYINNPELLQAQADVRATDEKVPQALSGWRPSVSVTGSLNGSKTLHSNASAASIPTGDPTGGGYNKATTQSVGVNINQNIFNSGATLAATEEAEYSVQAARAGLLAKEQDLFLKVAQADLDIRVGLEKIKVQQSNEDMLLQTLELTKAKQAAGDENNINVSQTKARLIDAQTQRILAESEVIRQKANYEKLTGIPYAGDSTLLVQLPAVPNNLITIETRSLEFNPQLVAAQKEEIAARATIDKVTASLLPKIDVQANAGKNHVDRQTGSAYWEYYNTLLNNETNLSVGITATIPIYDGGSTWSQRRETLQRLNSKRMAVKAAYNAVVEQARQAYQSKQTAVNNIAFYQSQVEEYRITVDGISEEVKLGSRILLEVLENQQKYVQAQLSLLNSQRDLYLAEAQILSLMGEFTARSLDLNVPYYDPMNNYNDVRNRWAF
jgi:outer membrane protein